LYPLLVESRKRALDFLYITCCDRRDEKARSLTGDLCILEDRSKLGLFGLPRTPMGRDTAHAGVPRSPQACSSAPTRRLYRAYRDGRNRVVPDVA
jgi:hypothetical protein